MKKKILLIGVPGFNLGDNAICDSLIRKINTSKKVYIWKAGIQDELAKKNIPIPTIFINRKSPLFHLQLIIAIFKSDLVMIGGGSIIQNEFGSSWLKGLTALFAEIVFISKLFRRQVVSAPIGVDNLSKNKGTDVAKYVLKNISLLTLRDDVSLDNVKKLNIKTAKTLISVDPAFELKTEAYPRITGNLVIAPAYEGNRKEYLNEIYCKIIRNYLDKDVNHSCTLLAMDIRDIEDGGYVKHLHQLLVHEYGQRIRYKNQLNHIDAIKILRSANAVFAMRLHAAILAIGYTPVFIMSRGVKTNTLAENFSIPYLDLKTDPKVDYVCDYFLKHFYSLENNENTELIVKSNISKRESHIKKLNIFLNEIENFI